MYTKKQKEIFWHMLPVASLTAGTMLGMLGMKEGIVNSITSFVNIGSLLFSTYLAFGGGVPKECAKLSDAFHKKFGDSLKELQGSFQSKKYSNFTLSAAFSVSLIGVLLLLSHIIPVQNTPSPILRNETLFFESAKSFLYLSSFFAIPLLVHLTRHELMPSRCLEISEAVFGKVIDICAPLMAKVGLNFASNATHSK